MSKQFDRGIIKDKLITLIDYTKSYNLARPFYSGIGHILLFHRVCPEKKIKRYPLGTGLTVAPEYLEKVIKFFTKYNYDFVSLEQLFNNIRRQKIDSKFVVVTFDDGYIDNFNYAYPIFKKHNIPFAIYITTNFAERKAVLWWCLLEELIVEKEGIAFELEGKVFEFNCHSWEEKAAAFYEISSIIKDSDENNCLQKIKKIFQPYKIDIFKKTEEQALSWAQIEQLSAEPLVTIGCHTLNHYVLSKLSEPAVREEIISAKRILQSRLNYEVKHFSYPFGGRGEAGVREFQIVKGCGFQTGTTSRVANIFPAHRDYLESLPRITMWEGVDSQRLKFLTSGLTPCIYNRFRKVVTV